MQELRNQTLAHFLASPGRFAVYGAGDTGEAVVRALGREGLKPGAFLDGYVTGERIGLVVLAPESALDFDCVVTAGRHARDMTVQLRADGFEGPVLDLSAAYQEPALAHFDEVRLDEADDEIAFARSLLEDDGSRTVFDALLRYRRSLDPGDLPPAPPAPGHPAVPVTAGEWVLDLGGDPEASLALAEAVGPLGRVHVLEPCTGRRAVLSDAAAASAFGARLVIHPLAWGGSCRRRPRQDDDDAPGIVTVDEFVWEKTSGRVDRLRLLGRHAGAALEGASATLSQHRPRVELSLSAGPADLWELPIRLKEHFAGCRLHLAHHSQGLSGTVCYARP